MANRVQQEDTHALVAAAQGGDRLAFGALVRLHQHEVYTLAVRLVADRDLAWDISQEVFVRAWKSLARFRGDAALSTWLHRITINVAWTQRRRRARHVADPLDEAFDAVDDDSLSPERAALSAAVGGHLADALTALPESQRIVVALKDIYGWSHQEIAEHLGITVTAGKVRLHRAHAALRKSLRDKA